MDNPWARDDEVIEGQATASAPFSSPPLRTFARLSIGEDDWGAAHRSSPSDRQAGSGWEHPESVKFGGSSKDEEERDVPWASEIDPSALHFPSAIPVFEQHSQSDYGHERPETARHSGDSQTYSNENDASLGLQRQGGCTPPWQASSPVHGSSGPNSRRASLGGSDTKSTDWKDEDSEDDWGKMDLPPLRPSVNGPDPSHQAEEENWPSMDLPPSKTELHRDALPVWDLPTVKPATTSRQRSAGNEGDANQKIVPADEPDDRPIGINFTPVPAEWLQDPGPSDTPVLPTSEPEKEPASTQPQAQPAGTGFFSSVFKRKAASTTSQPNDSSLTSHTDSKTSGMKESTSNSARASISSEPPVSSAAASPGLKPSFASMFSSTATASTSNNSQTTTTSLPATRVGSLDAQRPASTLSEVPAQTQSNAGPSHSKVQQPGGVRRFFSRFGRQKEEEDDTQEHVQPNKRLSSGSLDEVDDGAIGKQEAGILDRAGVSTLPSTISPAGLDLLEKRSSSSKNAPVPSTSSSNAIDDFFDSFERQQPTLSDATTRTRQDPLDPFASLVAEPTRRAQPTLGQLQQTRLQPPPPSRPSSVPAPPGTSSNNSRSSRPLSSAGAIGQPARGQTRTASPAAGIPFLPPPPSSTAPVRVGATKPAFSIMDDHFGSASNSSTNTSKAIPAAQSPSLMITTQSQVSQGGLSRADFDFFEKL